MTEMQGRQKEAGENYDRVPQNKDLHGEKETRLLTLSEHEQNVPNKIIKWQVKKASNRKQFFEYCMYKTINKNVLQDNLPYTKAYSGENDK